MENLEINATLSHSPESIVIQGKRNETKSEKFLLTNTSEVMFTCRSVTASCGCTIPSGITAGTTINPGESIELEFTIKLETPGTKYIYIFGNIDPYALSINLDITE